VKIRLCEDCVYADENGGEACETWSGFLTWWDGFGFIVETERFGDVIEIREPEFSFEFCDGCGRTTPGDRYPYEAYPIRRNARWTV
jgi:RNA polymerase subunit RPABC4/transcription elongation factor Spt4